MSTEVDVPAVGKVDKKWVYAGAAVAAGIVGYAWWTRLRQPAAPLPDPEGIPATDYTGTPGAGSSAPINVDGTDHDKIATNDQWVNYATEKLANLGWDPAPIPTALGKWLQRQPLGDREIEIVTSARGVAGDPPVGGPFPVVHAQPTPDPGGGGGGGGGTPPATRIIHVTGGTHLHPLMVQYGWGANYSPFFALNPGAKVGKANKYGWLSPTNPESRDPGSLAWGFTVDQDIKVPA